MNSPAPISRGYEIEDAHPRLIRNVAAIVAGTILASFVVVALRYHFGFSDVSGRARQTSFTGSPEYRTSIAAEWAGLDRDTDVHLHEYAWVDREHGIVRIPIDRAIDRLAAEAATPPKPKP
jgi:hypothetical protein